MIELKLNIDQVNVILAGLGKLPFEAVAGIVDEIRQQTIPQLKAMEDAKKAEMQPGEPE